ncbi:DUF1016 N-terminal domain-containing protein [Paraburkholderia sp. BL6669N2]|uniref:DUF1016 N-terminal domain-containing protein n=1 Tax=Paraburkholderia sp. BL6669N2 TaxID=1938807 RepID=UPI0028690B85|nr:DUF1016 N-terminal domain-containing protein [Paraburkholderia sp. BL6669N2]
MTKVAVAPGGYAGLHKEVVSVVESARGTAARNVNAVMTAAYWEIGRRIVAREQGGQARAGYGQALIARLADDLTRRFGGGFGKANLASMRAFYGAWPETEVFKTVSGKSAAPENVQTPSGKSLPAKDVVDATATAPDYMARATRFTLPWSAYVRLLSVKTAAAVPFTRRKRCAKAGRCASSTARSAATSTSGWRCRATRRRCSGKPPVSSRVTS